MKCCLFANNIPYCNFFIQSGDVKKSGTWCNLCMSSFFSVCAAVTPTLVFCADAFVTSFTNNSANPFDA